MNERLSLEIVAKAIGAETIDKLSASLDRYAKSSENAGRSGSSSMASGITSVGSAAQEAEKKVQSFVGAIPGMGVAAERFINLIPGLGKAIIGAFPVLGAIAFAEGLDRVGSAISNAMDETIGLKRAMDELKTATKSADDALASLAQKSMSLNVDKMTDQFGKAAGLRLKAGLGADEGQADYVKSREKYALVERLKKENALNNAVDPRLLIPGVAGDIYKAQKATLDALTQEAEAAQATGEQ
ncbi:MAG: hypothetical protein JWN34_2256 [Bryobacterales bacterium]|nr:hypothetical protein [Bryobacterales bacterium]